jgi:hypothetical protein
MKNRYHKLIFTITLSEFLYFGFNIFLTVPQFKDPINSERCDMSVVPAQFFYT